MRPITFNQYNPMEESNWEIGTEEKGTCYAIKRADTGGLICKLSYGLRTEEKALATMLANVPEMVYALKEAKALLENPEAEAKDADEVLALISAVLEISK